ncbi:MFS transporter [Streptomyces sp. NPDC020755]|uniref:MFS transporter n=1 Tax=Streptomyces sp. NPDC020755 TaxID=3154790 RepID=UPI0033FDE468
MVTTVPETVAHDITWKHRPMRLAVPMTVRVRYAAAAMHAFTASAMFGLFISLAPGFLSTRLGIGSLAVSGAGTFLVLASAAGFQLLVARLSLQRQALLGIALLGSGLVVVTVGLTVVSLWALLTGGVLAGAGAGTAYKAAIGSVIAMTEPDCRGEALAGLFLGGYAGMSVPVLGLGLLMLATTTTVAVLVFSAVLAGVLVLTLLLTPHPHPTLTARPHCGRPRPRTSAVKCPIPPQHPLGTTWKTSETFEGEPCLPLPPQHPRPGRRRSAPSNSVTFGSTASWSTPTPLR